MNIPPSIVKCHLGNIRKQMIFPCFLFTTSFYLYLAQFTFWWMQNHLLDEDWKSRVLIALIVPS